MIRSTLKIAFRHLRKEKVFTLLNVMGLAMALAASLFIIDFVIEENSYDDKVPQVENKYRLTLTVNERGDIQTYASNYYPLAPVITESIPEVISYNRFYYLDKHAIVTVGEERYNEMDILFADMSFFEFFGYSLDRSVQIDEGTDQAFLSHQMANKYFGKSDAVGQTIKVNTEDGEYLFTVGGVFDESEGSSHIKPKVILPFQRLASNSTYQRAKWIWSFFGTYLELSDGADRHQVESKLNQFISEVIPEVEGTDITVNLQPVEDIHLEPGLTYEYATVGSGLITTYLTYAVIFILILAYVNYINLTNARNRLRVKEVGVRKVLGSGNFSITMQLLTEAFAINSFAIVVAMTIVQVAVPAMVAIGMDLNFDLYSKWYFVPCLIMVLILGTLITGLLPSLMMSRVKAGEAVGRSTTSGKSGPRTQRVMVFTQIAITMIMITSVLIMRAQLRYMITKQKGVNLEQIVAINGPRVSFDMDGSINYQGFLNSLSGIPGIQTASVSSSVPGAWMGNASLTANSSEPEIPVQAYRADAQFFECYGIQLKAGRFFNDSDADQRSVVVNESAIARLGLASPQDIVDKKVLVGTRERVIVGVVADYHHFNLKQPVYPTVITPSIISPEYFSIKLSSLDSHDKTLSAIQNSWNQHYPGDPFDYYYQDTLFERSHAFESTVIQIFTLFTALAIFIALIGLIGLATFVTNRRVKEIGVRKVLGASVPSILILLIRDFLYLILFGLIASIPFVYYGMVNWLDNYAYRIAFPWWVIPVAAGLLVGVTILTISYQTIKTALADPVESLRYE